MNTRLVLGVLWEPVPSLKTLFIVAFEDGNELDRPEMFFSQYGPRGDTKLIKIDHCTSHCLRARDDRSLLQAGIGGELEWQIL